MLKATGLTKTFNGGTPNEVRALDSVNLGFDDGAFVVVVGTNGSGKSTLLGALAGEFPLDGGRIELDGIDITGWPVYRRARWIGRVFQNPFAGTAPGMTIAENLTLAARRDRRFGLARALSRRRRETLVQKVQSLNMGLEGRLDHEIGNLSGGQRQALTLLMATWVKPRLLLLDEHTAALDPKTAAVVIRLTREIVGRDRLTTLMVTHSMQQAANLGDRLIMMHRGRIIQDVREEDKRRLRAEDLLERFEDLRRTEALDASAADLLRNHYV